MMQEEVPVLAVVVATRGGQELPAALASLAWARERVVLDPLGCVSGALLPRGVQIVRGAACVPGVGTSPWLLLVAEHESAGPALRDAVATVTGGAPAAFRAPLELDTLGLRFALRPAPVRLAPRARCRVALDRGLELRLDAAALPERLLGATLSAHRGASVSEILQTLEPESHALAALLAQLDRQPGGVTIASAPLVSLLRVLRAPAAAPAGLARWIASVFAAYRVVVAHIRLWEWRHAQAAAVREIG